MRLKKEERRQQLIEIATKLFSEKGYKKTTTKEIAEAAKVSEPVIYKHFKGKKDLFVTSFFMIIIKTFENTHMEHEENISKIVEAFVYSHFKNIEENFNLFKSYLVALLENEEVRQKHIQELAPILNKEINKKLISRNPGLRKALEEKGEEKKLVFIKMISGGMMMPFALSANLFGVMPMDMDYREVSKEIGIAVELYLKGGDSDE